MPPAGPIRSRSKGGSPDPTEQGIRTLARRIARAPLAEVSGTLCRAVRNAYLQRTPPEPLYHLASKKKGARYTRRGGNAALYLASDQPTAFAEIRDLEQGAGGQPLPLDANAPVMLVYVEVELHRVLDLTDAAVRKSLRVTRKAILAEWEGPMHAYHGGAGPMPLTQQLGEAAHRTRAIRGILYPSARWKDGRCLVVFPDRLTRTDGIASYDPAGLLAQRLGPTP